jgi:hypothetical protein
LAHVHWIGFTRRLKARRLINKAFTSLSHYSILYLKDGLCQSTAQSAGAKRRLNWGSRLKHAFQSVKKRRKDEEGRGKVPPPSIIICLLVFVKIERNIKQFWNIK